MGAGPGQEKISAEFAARLVDLGPREQVRAVILLHLAGIEETQRRRGSQADREAALEAVRRSAERGLADVDAVLERCGGQRLAPHPDALGSLPVQTTAAGIAALATSDYVKAILEDQPTARIP